MSKGLEALEKAKKRNGLPLNKEFAPVTIDELDIVEKELKENERYKAIEQEFGIDLVTLFKALTDCIAVKNENGTIDVMWACPRFQISIDKSDSWILYGSVEEQKYVSIKDYGKTWALTKGDLELL